MPTSAQCVASRTLLLQAFATSFCLCGLIVIADKVFGKEMTDRVAAPRNILSAPSSADLERRVKAAYARCIESVVCIKSKSGVFSGVIVNDSGKIATVAHHGLPPKTKVTVVFANGREAAGTILGSHRILDAGMVALDGVSEWPAVPFGRSTEVTSGEPCILVGYAGQERGSPPMRMGMVLAPAAGATLRASCYGVGGDSGCGLFDLQGRLLGVCVGVGPRSRFLGAEAYSRLYDRLAASEEINAVVDEELPPIKDDAKAQGIVGRVAPAVVKMFVDGGEKQPFCGVVVGTDGEILTGARRDFRVGGQVKVAFSDGTSATATVLGQSLLDEIALLRLDGQTERPAVPLGRAVGRLRGEPCVAMLCGENQGAIKDQWGRLIASGEGSFVFATNPASPNDVGAPLFDAEGRLIGIGALWLPGDKGTRYVGTEVFLRLREQLRQGLSADESPRYEPADDIRQLLAAAGRTIVELRAGDDLAAHGLIVESDGWIISKRTELSGYEQLACRLTDGRQFDARIVASDQEHDLALLKLNATDLPAVRWSEKQPIEPGQIVIPLRPQGAQDAQPRFAFVGATNVVNPASSGYPPFTLQPNENTPIFAEPMIYLTSREYLKWHGMQFLSQLKSGDVIQRVDGMPTRTVAEFRKALQPRMQRGGGERIELRVQRGGESIIAWIPLLCEHEPTWGRLDPPSLRRDGFPNVFSHDGLISPSECVTPVVDRHGDVVGVNIAHVAPFSTYAIPSEVVQHVVTNLKNKVRSDSPPPAGR